MQGEVSLPKLPDSSCSSGRFTGERGRRGRGEEEREMRERCGREGS